MKVVTSCSGRFHIFDQAAELNRHRLLARLINDYPKSQTRRWGIPDDKVTALVFNGVLARFSRHSHRLFSASFQTSFIRFIHNFFSSRVARMFPMDADVFIGLSSFCLEAIVAAKAQGMTAIVDHGSLHQRYERNLILEECDRLHISTANQLTSDWLIYKEDQEFHAADQIMVLSHAAKRSMVAEQIPAEKLFVNPCGVDLTAFRPTFDRKEGVFRVIFCGKMSPRKGVHYLLQAFQKLGFSSAELWLIGSPPDAVFREALEPFMTPQVKTLGAFPQTRLSELYGQGSVFVLPSVADGFGMVVPQAMACGLPVIVTENVGAADIVSEGVDGFIVPIRDVEALSQKLSLLYENPEMRIEMGRAASRKADGQLSWEAYGDRLVGFLESCVSLRACRS